MNCQNFRNKNLILPHEVHNSVDPARSRDQDCGTTMAVGGASPGIPGADPARHSRGWKWWAAGYDDSQHSDTCESAGASGIQGIRFRGDQWRQSGRSGCRRVRDDAQRHLPAGPGGAQLAAGVVGDGRAGAPERGRGVAAGHAGGAGASRLLRHLHGAGRSHGRRAGADRVGARHRADRGNLPAAAGRIAAKDRLRAGHRRCRQPDDEVRRTGLRVFHPRHPYHHGQRGAAADRGHRGRRPGSDPRQRRAAGALDRQPYDARQRRLCADPHRQGRDEQRQRAAPQPEPAHLRLPARGQAEGRPRRGDGARRASGQWRHGDPRRRRVRGVLPDPVRQPRIHLRRGHRHRKPDAGRLDQRGPAA